MKVKMSIGSDKYLSSVTTKAMDLDFIEEIEEIVDLFRGHLLTMGDEGKLVFQIEAIEKTE